MKHLKRFNENQKPSISFEDAKSWIKDNYSEDRVIDIFDEEIMNWVDREQMEEEGIESEYDWYIDYGRGEAEQEVIDSILNDLQKNYELEFDLFSDDTDLFQFLKDEYNCLFNS
jgi:hypothetical protein